MKDYVVDPLNHAQNQATREKQCPSCGKRFECCAGGCWCDTVSLTEEARTSLLPYVGCLCPVCLARHASLDAH
jgi:ribosomal protein L34E